MVSFGSLNSITFFKKQNTEIASGYTELQNEIARLQTVAECGGYNQDFLVDEQGYPNLENSLKKQAGESFITQTKGAVLLTTKFTPG